MNQENSDSKKIREFTDLIVWKEAHKLVIIVYEKTKKFPKEEIFGLTSQLKRASVSVSSNIAEGFGRQSYKEKIQFYYLAHGSLVEIKNQIIVARDVSYLAESDFNKLMDQVVLIQRLLQGFISKSKTFL